MRRRSPIFSLPSILIFCLLLVGLGLTTWRQGGRAFSPGGLSSSGDLEISLAGFESHADFEDQCGLCHQPLTGLQADRCMECHTNIREQVTVADSLHGKLEGVMKCFECHSDHQGREYDLRLGGMEDFDHFLPAFSLIWHQLDFDEERIACTDCHVTDSQFSVLNSSCTACHSTGDEGFVIKHIVDFGEECIACHDGLDSMARFDHANSNFKLEGVHLEQPCVECHIMGQFEGLPGDCVDCHAEPGMHLGMFGLDCEACHASSAWSPAWLQGSEFNHDQVTRFSLDRHQVNFDGSSISCQSCHQESNGEFSTDTCIGCHEKENQAFIQQHQFELGNHCLACHDGVDRMRDFDHQDAFRLDGGHLGLECQACHFDQVYQGTPQECMDCHAEPEIHLGFFGLTCEYCHETSSWYPAQLTQHAFPIDHGDEGESECQTCHVVTYSDYTCYSCHEHSLEETLDKHRDLDLTKVELAQCAECHLDGQVHELKESED